MTDNTASDKTGGGVFAYQSTVTLVNNFLCNNGNFIAKSGPESPEFNWNVVFNRSLILEDNIVGGPYCGGNVYSTPPEYTGFSDTHVDANYDGICDEGYTIYDDQNTIVGTDAYPLVYGGFVQINSSVAGATVYINGTDTALLTNRSFYLPPVGVHIISVTLAGYQNPDSRTVTISNSGPNDPVLFSLSPSFVHPTVWNVSHIDGGGNYTNVSLIPEIGDGGHHPHLGGADGHTYEGGFTINAANVTIKEWDRSPAAPLITNTSHSAPAISITADNVTLQALDISGNTYGGGGAGVSVEGNSTTQLYGFTIADCAFSGNSAADGGYGGAVSLRYVSNSRIMGTTFNGNSAGGAGGGGVYISESEGAALTGILFENNSAGECGGGGVNIVSNGATLTHTIFENNTAMYGGGAGVEESEDTVLNGVIFDNNTATFYGGGGACFINSNNGVIKNTIVTRNDADDVADGYGGGGGILFCESSDADITNTTFTSNSANEKGGGLSFVLSENAGVANSTFRNNSVIANGGGVYAWGDVVLL
ncbi:right-handed parallel beta-helix repeat-containing protein [Methanogenium cariaci]|uniref:right-handed parallel beta-helix repeat-containing protein n=1 Tax=Methanogenium cariaci TaxID=2197 RepID=UPI00248099FC|nr:right-handed parallel beta-helix repeat-containing protein [Methanogenium cariaci]